MISDVTNLSSFDNLPPLTQAQLIARREAEIVILQHLGLCPFSVLKIEERVRLMENQFNKLIGFMLGSGLLGGAAGGLVSHFLGK